MEVQGRGRLVNLSYYPSCLSGGMQIPWNVSSRKAWARAWHQISDPECKSLLTLAERDTSTLGR